MIRISHNHVDQMIKQAVDQLPNECCGVLAGITDGESVEITDIYPMVNVDASPEHFSLDPKEQFEVLYKIRDKGLKMLGNYHSHPSTPSRPSREDIRLAYDPKAIYVIISLKDEIPVVKAFSITNDQYTEVPLTIQS